MELRFRSKRVSSFKDASTHVEGTPHSEIFLPQTPARTIESHLTAEMMMKCHSTAAAMLVSAEMLVAAAMLAATRLLAVPAMLTAAVSLEEDE